jgi:ribosomal protein L37AE/L43A
MNTNRFCPRCGKLGVRVTHPTMEIWNCPAKHGEIHRGPLPVPTEEELAATAAPRVHKPKKEKKNGSRQSNKRAA